MKNQPPIVSRVQDEIREDNWNGTAFKYPACRVAVEPFGPTDSINGQCHFSISDISFTVYVYTEGTSSKECAQIASVVFNALLQKKIETDEIATVVMISSTSSGLGTPVPESERAWRADLRFFTRLKAKNVD